MFFGGALVSCSAAPAHLPADMPATLPGQGGLLTMRVTLPHTVLRPQEWLKAELTVTSAGSEEATVALACQGQVRCTALDDQGQSIRPAEAPRPFRCRRCCCGRGWPRMALGG